MLGLTLQKGFANRVLQFFNAMRERGFAVNAFSSEDDADKYVGQLERILKRQRQSFIPLGLLRDRRSSS
jgi:hypothetical protein